MYETLQLMVLDNSRVVTCTLDIELTYVQFFTVDGGCWNGQYHVASLAAFIVTHVRIL
jgi:hypothetical protein